jgi:hypothetical protein
MAAGSLRVTSSRFLTLAFLCLAISTDSAEPPAKVRLIPPVAGVVHNARQINALSTTVVNFTELSHKKPPAGGEVRALVTVEVGEDPLEPISQISPGPPEAPSAVQTPSPSPTSNFMGLDDIPMVDSLYIIIPPDVGGAVGPTRVMDGHNNNYRVIDKATGAVISTVGTATFWAPSGETDLNGLTDPRTLYDPYNNCWIAVMQTISTNNFLVGVSQTSDPAGNWFLYRFNSGNTPIDFPNVGFNKNWIAISINQFTKAGLFSNGLVLAVNYPQALAGTGTGTLFSLAHNSGFCVSPAATYSATEDTLFAITHLASSGATYTIDWITGTAAAPVYHVGGSTLTRPGGGWAQPGGQLLPQSAPNSGTASCSPPCPIETQDAQIRSAPSFRGGFLYYAQTIGLPSTGLTHTAVQWTKINANSSGAFVDGGRIEDPTANSTNGGKWYSYTHIAVNSLGDFIVGYSQFSSAQHPSAGYSMHLAGDAAGTLRDPFIYKAGEDYYHKDFGSTRNRWGDFSTAQVDPTDDRTLWVLQEYAKARVNTNDGTTGANGSRWSNWWASVNPSPPFIITASAGANGAISPSGAVSVVPGASQGFTITPNACFSVADVLVDGSSVGPVTTFTFPAVSANHTISATFALQTFAVTATAGTGGTIAPSGPVSVNCGSNQSFTITASPCQHIVDVLVDGSSVGAVTTFNFTNVTAPHTIAASFAPDLSASIGNVTQYEGNSGTTAFDFPVRLSGPCATASVAVGWKSVDGTALVSDSDYAPDSTFFTFPPGATTGTVTVQVSGDLTPEGNETFHVQLFPSSAAVAAGAGDGVGTILNDDGITGVDETSSIRELSFAVRSGNPSSDAVSFRLGIPGSTSATLSVYDVTGRMVARVYQGGIGAGYHDLTWNAKSGAAPAGSGVYFVRLTAAGKTLVRRFVLLR